MRARRTMRLGHAPRLFVACACLLTVPVLSLAQETQHTENNATSSESTAPRERRQQDRRLYFGMWTTHLKEHVVAFDNNWVIGMSYHGYFGATFINSFGRRAFSGGLQRTI